MSTALAHPTPVAAHGDPPAPRDGLRIAVLVKHVPDAPVGRGFDADGLADRDGPGLLSELDEFPLEAARRLVEAVGGEVVAVSVGPPAARDGLRRALQLGATTAVLVTDERLRGSDGPVTARVLARAIERLLPVDLVLTGAVSADGGSSIVPAQVAALLGLPALTHGASLEVADGVATVRRDDGRATVTLAAPLPALVSLTDRAEPPRYPSFATIMAARRATLVEWDLDDLGLAPDTVGIAGSSTRVRTVIAEPPRPPGRVITDDGTAGDALVAFLVERHLV